MTNHLLIDWDSTIPNLALMKISAWAKARGDHVDFGEPSNIERINEVWISCTFSYRIFSSVSNIFPSHCNYLLRKYYTRVLNCIFD